MRYSATSSTSLLSGDLSSKNFILSILELKEMTLKFGKICTLYSSLVKEAIILNEEEMRKEMKWFLRDVLKLAP